ncbi:unnamed protein product [Hydatigera taeniaeformis]|uniref:Transmembrane protein n=1 Tax=Hydatigena taeniaeformis TaxID=6205 RepID=A0A0R3WP56_HYDTA|nr:unnamed protein product [Hydatigera taeniaeformis]
MEVGDEASGGGQRDMQEGGFVSALLTRHANALLHAFRNGTESACASRLADFSPMVVAASFASPIASCITLCFSKANFATTVGLACVAELVVVVMVVVVALN